MPVGSRERGLEDLGCLVKEFVLWVLKSRGAGLGFYARWCVLIIMVKEVNGGPRQTEGARTAVYTGTFH